MDTATRTIAPIQPHRDDITDRIASAEPAPIPEGWTAELFEAFQAGRISLRRAERIAGGAA